MNFSNGAKLRLRSARQRTLRGANPNDRMGGSGSRLMSL